MTTSKIEWTQRTWNPVVGCSLVSPGCTNCYAMKQAARIQKMNPTGGSGSNYVNHYDGTTKSVNGNVVWTGKIAIAPDRIFLEPLRRRQPTTWFVNSMSDLFYEDVPDEVIDRVFAVMALCRLHTFQVLTKRDKRMHDYCSTIQKHGRWLAMEEIALQLGYEPRGRHDFGFDWLANKQFLPNVWLGVSCEDQARADERIPLLLQTPAAVRFISAEPLLGPIDFEKLIIGDEQFPLHALTLLDWVIVGGESGPNARPMHPTWARKIRDDCAASGVPLFFKQWGSWFPCAGEAQRAFPTSLRGNPDNHCAAWPDGTLGDGHHRKNGGFGAPLLRVGKKAAGRLLDGVEHPAFPDRRA